VCVQPESPQPSETPSTCSREQLQLGARMFGGFVIGAIAAGWLLYPLPF
jgi:hypothetical protein